MSGKNFRKFLDAGILVVVLLTTGFAQNRPRAKTSTAIPTNTLQQIIRAEDERRWDDKLKSLLSDKNPKVRKRAALASGRIGDERAVEPLAQLLKSDSNNDVRQMAAFAIGEIESAAGADVLLSILGSSRSAATVRPSGRGPEIGELASNEVRARAVEALGKIAAALPDAEKDRKRVYGEAILNVLRVESDRSALSDRLTILLGLTAALRAKPDGAGSVIVRFLNHYDPRIVADALNVMARLRLKDGNERVRQLLNNGDIIVRANAARVLGAMEDKQSFEPLLDRALHDYDLRVRVSAIRALGNLKDRRAVEPLVTRGNSLIHLERLVPSSRNELLEIATTLGRILPNSFDKGAVAFLEKMHNLTRGEAVEVEVAFARIVPGIFQNDHYKSELKRQNVTWRQVSRRAQGLAAIRDVVTGAATNSAGEHAL